MGIWGSGLEIGDLGLGIFEWGVGSDLKRAALVRVLARKELHVLCFRVQGSGFRVQGAGFRVQGLGLRVEGAGLRGRVLELGLRVSGSGSRVETRGARRRESRRAPPGCGFGGLTLP